MADPYETFSNSLVSPLIGGFAVTPADGADLAQVTRQIRITGNAGNVAVVWASGLETTEPVLAGETLDWRIKRIKSTGTTATGIRGYY